jgi:O-6-methylguanine DNA methyltransferase
VGLQTERTSLQATANRLLQSAVEAASKAKRTRPIENPTGYVTFAYRRLVDKFLRRQSRIVPVDDAFLGWDMPRRVLGPADAGNAARHRAEAIRDAFGSGFERSHGADRGRPGGLFFGCAARGFSVPKDYRGTPFERRVWEEVLRIPYGETRSYEELAVAVGRPNAARAVGRANGRNRIAILIPCHRVVRKDGQLGGYGVGIRRKEYLLDLERFHPALN